MWAMLSSVDVSGWVPLLIAAFSAGRPNASQPKGCSTLYPRILNRFRSERESGTHHRLPREPAAAKQVRQHEEVRRRPQIPIRSDRRIEIRVVRDVVDIEEQLEGLLPANAGVPAGAHVGLEHVRGSRAV